MNLPAFTLYGIIGCSHCAEAEDFLSSHNLPTILVIANGDLVAEMGVRAITKKETAEYPVLVYRYKNELKVGFEREKYEEFARDFYSRNSTGTPSIFSGGQQSQPQAPIQG